MASIHPLIGVFLVLSISGFSSQNTPLQILLQKRDWDIPLDAIVGTPITRFHIVDRDPTPKNITCRLEKVTQNYGPFHDASGYFGLFELSIGRKDKKFEVFLEKPLLGNFQAGDQFNLAIVVHNGKETSKLEVYGRIEEARDKSLQPNDLTTSSTFPTPKTTTPTSTSSPILSTKMVPVFCVLAWKYLALLNTC